MALKMLNEVTTISYCHTTSINKSTIEYNEGIYR